MTSTPTAALIDAAVARGGAVPAFNVIGIEHAEAVIAGAMRASTGVLLQLSENAVRYRGHPLPILAACRALADAADVPVGIHLDHVEDAGLIEWAIAEGPGVGLGSIMVDASRLGDAENAAATADAAGRARAAGLWVEAELGEVGGKDGAHAPGVRTDPTDAAAFVAATGVDGLAVAVGSSHAMRDRSAELDVDLIGRLAAAVPVPLVLHGSSGVSDAGIRAAVAAGIRKVNVGTALNLAGTAALRTALAADPAAVDPRRYGAPARDAMADVVAHLCGVIAGR